jgi:predicted unusual protein kinase regulating ubiquinone biosynthesis (AarF/ABC1/UbiB family)
MLKIGSIGVSFMYNLITGNGEEINSDNNLLQNNFRRLHALRETLEQHGGLFSKVAQMLSYGDLNSSVFSECKPFSKNETIKYIKNEVHPDYKIDYDVYKSGSIGQVHIGTFKDGTKLAVKVQYVGLVEQTESDIQALDILSSFLYVFADIKDAIKDIKKKIAEELDYKHEAMNHDVMYNKWKNTSIYIPKIYRSLCTQKILVTEFVEGCDLSSFINNATQESKNKIARDIVHFIFKNIYKYGIFYSDCHYGNLIIKDNRLIVLDFGCINAIDESMVKLLKKLHNALKYEDKILTLSILSQLNILGSDVSLKSLDYAYDYFRLQYTPWIIEDEFEFTQEWWKKSDYKDTKLMSEWVLPTNMVYFNKIPYGLYNILTALNAKSNFFEIMNDIFNCSS